MNLEQFLNTYIGISKKLWFTNDGKSNRHWKIFIQHDDRLVNITQYIARFLKLRFLDGGFLTANYGGGNMAGIREDFENLCAKNGFNISIFAEII